MSSDIDEFGEDFEIGGSPNGGPERQRHSSSGSSARRCSLPCDRPSAAIRRHLQQFKTRRKTSAPCAPPAIVAANTPACSPLETMSGYPLAELLERLRPAATTSTSRQPSTSTDSGVTDSFSCQSSSSSNRRYSMDTYSFRSSCSTPPPRTVGSVDEGFQSGLDDRVRKPLFVDTNLANTAGNGPATVPRRCLYYRQASVAGVPDEAAHFPRQRSNSEAGRYLLMRKCTENRSEFVGKLEEGEWAYCQILATLKCCDLMPHLAKMVVVDSSLPIRKAFLAFVQNNIRAAPIWDGQKKLFVGLLTVTDLMHLLLEYAGEYGDVSAPTTPMGEKSMRMSFEDLLDLPLHTRTRSSSAVQRRNSSPLHFFNSGHQPYVLNHLIYALADETVAKAAKLLCDRRLHRLLILDPDNGGNALFLLSKKDVLKALKEYIAKLPLPPCMDKTLDELLIGTWSGPNVDLTTVTFKTTIHSALSLLLGRRHSALPVVDANYKIVDMLTKVDIMNLIIDNHGPVEGILQKTVQEAIKKRPAGAEKMTTCSKKASMLLAVECILHSGAHRLAIVDSEGRLEGMLSLADLMRFLTSGFSALECL